MGSIEVYDNQQQKWVPYIGDPDKWYQHFKDVRDGYAKPDRNGRYIVGSGNSHRRLETLEAKLKEANQKLKETEEKLKNAQHPVVKLVSPVAQANEIAQSEVKRLKAKQRPKRKKLGADIDWNPLKKRRTDRNWNALEL